MIMVIGGRCQGKSSFAKEHFENRVQEKGKTQETCLEDHQKERLEKRVAFSFWEKMDESHTVVRFATSWATKMEDVKALIEIL